jgi:hypothetical protein
MIRRLLLVLPFIATLHAGVRIDVDSLGTALGGWKPKKSIVDYSLSGSDYRTYKPEVSPTPEGGIFVSIRIDYLRGWFSSDDHAVLEVTIDKAGAVVSAQSSLALQGVKITSDVIRAGGSVGKDVPVVGTAVKVGADMTADLTSKLMRENIVEPGRVNFPAVVRHNYNHLFQSIRVMDGNALLPLDPEKNEHPAPPMVAPPVTAPPKLDVKGAPATKTDEIKK